MEDEEKTDRPRGRPCLEGNKRKRRVAVRMMNADYQALEAMRQGRSINQVVIDLIRSACKDLALDVP